jgi:putative hydrolase of the HAD superfamily
MDKTQLSHKFDRLITVHEFSMPKEDPNCWQEVHKRHPFRGDRTLLIDDNLHALESAREYGIDHLLAITQPDSQQPPRQIDDFDAIHSFDEIMPVNEVIVDGR